MTEYQKAEAKPEWVAALARHDAAIAGYEADGNVREWTREWRRRLTYFPADVPDRIEVSGEFRSLLLALWDEGHLEPSFAVFEDSSVVFRQIPVVEKTNG